MTKVKICGITNFEDARHALLSGADYLGFIFYPSSPRAVTASAAGDIAMRLRKDPDTATRLAGESRALLVGVFVNETAQVIAATLATCGLDLAQLSGDEPAEVVTGSESPIVGQAYQALRPQSADEARGAAPLYSAPTPVVAPTLLLDTYHPALRGGTGKTADWELAVELRKATPRLMLAGGLTPGNVAGAIRHVRPFAVDVASGVEAGPGRKDHVKVEHFIEAAKHADKSIDL